MSVKVMGWVWEHSEARASALLLLLALADFAHDDGGSIFPSVKTLAMKIRMSERQTQNLLRQLERAEEIEKVGFGPAGTNCYRIHMARSDYPSMGKPSLGNPKLQVQTLRGCDALHQRGVNRSTQSVIDPSERSSPTDLGQLTLTATDSDDEPFSPEDLKESWNDFARRVHLPIVEQFAEVRRHKCAARLREHPEVQFWSRVFTNIELSRFLIDDWRVTFDWLVKNSTNVLKVYEGNYLDRTYHGKAETRQLSR